MKFPELLTVLNARVRVAVGNCALGEEWEEWPDGTIESAHAHFNERGWKNNWICIRDPLNICKVNGTVTIDMLHELAHLIDPIRVGEAKHGTRWQRAMRELGQRANGTTDPAIEEEIEKELVRKAASRRKRKR